MAVIGSMGLLYSTGYVDFDDNWKQVRTNPPEFEVKAESAWLDVFDVSQKSYKLKFKNGARVKSFRVVGKFRLTWDDSYLLEKC